MKKLMAIIAAVSVATSTAAGNLVYTAPEVTALENPDTMGGSGAWLIPLIIIALLALSLTSNNQNSPENSPINGITR